MGFKKQGQNFPQKKVFLRYGCGKQLENCGKMRYTITNI